MFNFMFIFMYAIFTMPVEATSYLHKKALIAKAYLYYSTFSHKRDQFSKMYMDPEYNKLLLFKQLSLWTTNCLILPLDSQENTVSLLNENQNYLMLYWKQARSALLGFNNTRKLQLVKHCSLLIYRGGRGFNTYNLLQCLRKRVYH